MVKNICNVKFFYLCKKKTTTAMKHYQTFDSHAHYIAISITTPYTPPKNYNRYSYALNNPLKYVDPDGEVFLTWNIIKTGLSIGVNFTPEGVPLGFGINVRLEWRVNIRYLWRNRCSLWWYRYAIRCYSKFCN